MCFHMPGVKEYYSWICRTAPAILSGAGDNFNAGLVAGMLTGLADEALLAFAVEAAGYYVRNGRSRTAG